METILLFTNIAPHYRKALWTKLLGEESFDIKIYFGENRSGIKPIDFERLKPRLKQNTHKIKNFYFKRILLWQGGVISTCLFNNFDHCIFSGDMYTISTWLALIICKLRGVNCIMWGHGLYGNEGSFKKLLRLFFFSLADYHLLYEKRAKDMLSQEGFNKDKLHVIFNSLDYHEQKKMRDEFNTLTKDQELTFFTNPNLPLLIFVGRLTSEKKLDLLLHLANNLNMTKVSVNLLIIGDGEEMTKLQNNSYENLNSECLHFYGSCHDERIIGKFLSLADLCVSPGNVGLTAIHALSFGTPVATHSNFNNQGPESGAIIPDSNGFLFAEDDIDNLVIKTKQWLELKQDRIKIREACYKVIDDYYNPDYQLSIIKDVIKGKLPKI